MTLEGVEVLKLECKQKNESKQTAENYIEM